MLTESARKINAQLNFSIYRMSQMLFGVEKLILGKKVDKVIGHSHLTVKSLICKITPDMLKTIWSFKTREHVRNTCLVMQRYRVFNIFSRISQYLCMHFLFSVCHLGEN